jgi:hypothetical protein
LSAADRGATLTEEFRTFIEKDALRWAKVIKDPGVEMTK